MITKIGERLEKWARAVMGKNVHPVFRQQPPHAIPPALINAVDAHNKAFGAQIKFNKGVQSQLSSLAQQLGVTGSAQQHVIAQKNTPGLSGLSGILSASPAVLSQQSGAQGLLGSALAQATQQFPGGTLSITGNPTASPWEAFLAGRTPTAELGLKFLNGSPSGFWAEPLNLVLGECLARIKELEDSNPWQKSYDQIADEREAKNGVR